MHSPSGAHGSIRNLLHENIEHGSKIGRGKVINLRLPDDDMSAVIVCLEDSAL